MARKNRFSKNKIVVKKNIITDENNTFDGLPTFEPDNDGVVSLEIIKSNGKNATIIFNSNKQIICRKLPRNERGGIVIPTWYYPLYQFNPDIATELARVCLSILKESNYHSNLTKPFNYLTEYFISKNISSLEAITLLVFNNMIEQIDSSRPSILCQGIKRVLAICPSISERIKKDIQAYVYAPSKKKKTEKSFAERLANSNLKNDYSEYVMFQVYAYTNASIIEVEATIKSTREFIEGSEDKSVGFFHKGGAEHYKSLIMRGNKESFDKAFQIELADTYRVNNAIDIIKASLTIKQWAEFKKKVLMSEYDNLNSECWPINIKNNPDVLYLCNKVIPITLGNVSSIKRTFFNQAETQEGIYGDLLYRKRLHAWRTKQFREKYRLHQLNKYQINFIFFSFYNLKETGTYNGDSLHTILLGRTLHFDYLLMQLLLAESGRNKEVAHSIPNKINGSSILDNEDRFSTEKSVELIGSKKRGHINTGGEQPESLSIPKSTPLFRFMKLFDDVRDQQLPYRLTFFTETDVFARWQRKYASQTGIKEKNGTPVKTIDTTKFRKVFAGEMLQKWMKKIKNKDDLIKAVAGDLQNTIPLTYLLQSSTVESMLTTAIVALQLKFIEHHQKVSVQIKINEKPSSGVRVKRFLCDCIDPENPDYAENLDVSYCKQFDNCLGCSKAEVYQEHLPYIIYRCFQYENILKLNRSLYDAAYALKHIRAKQVINSFILKASNGEKLHNASFEHALDAWEDPNNFLLPPLLHSNA
ncbi:hypothetical protein [Colwellia psychrerythraea]|uniref:Uncharacterized protein n=1 Tax=Colwellia psychrerythraea TaxID=28229 RepID=A0A099KHB1_COLPS|nr:hypothetical protein [Colwellia psychrerythraea]KGJ89610.1 hypothetical protein ND2E_3801 [Colwellia psychrerythraea]